MIRTFTPDPGIAQQVLSEAPELLPELIVVSFKFKNEGAEGKLHRHPHIQSTFVRAGRFRFSVAGEVMEVGTGDSFVVPTNGEHACGCLAPGELIDTVTPRRDDFF